MSSSSMSIEVVVRRMAQGPSTWYSCVSMRPLWRVLARAGDGQFPFGLEKFQGVAGFLGALLLGDGEDLVFQVGLAHVVEALAGHGGVFDDLFGREEGKHRLHEGALARRAGALDDDGEGLGKFP